MQISGNTVTYPDSSAIARTGLIEAEGKWLEEAIAEATREAVR